MAPRPLRPLLQLSQVAPDLQHPFVVWPHGANGCRGYTVQYPDFNVEASALDLNEAIRLADAARMSAERATARPPLPGQALDGICERPVAPLLCLTRWQVVFAIVEAAAIRAARTDQQTDGRGRDATWADYDGSEFLAPFGWALTPPQLISRVDELLEDKAKLAGRLGKGLPKADAVEGWRRQHEYIGLVAARAF